MLSETEFYLKKQELMLNEYENACLRCGACCGLQDNDPCVNLQRASCGKYYCKIYNNRLGAQKTISGKSFTCVPIRDNLKYAVPHQKCGYTKRRGFF